MPRAGSTYPFGRLLNAALIRPSLFLALLFSLQSSCLAVLTVWEGTNGDGLWDSSNAPVGGDATTNWRGKLIPGSADQIIFEANSLKKPGTLIDLNGDRSVLGVYSNDSPATGSIVFTLGATVGSETLTVGGGSAALANYSIYTFPNNALLFNCNLHMNDTSGDNVFSIVLQNAPITLNGVLSGSNHVQIDGSRTVYANNANTCTGNFTVGAILNAGNTSGSATGSGTVLVSSGGALTGTGRIAGAVTVNAGGEIHPGNAIGTLTLNSNLTVQGTYRCELNATNADRLNIGGTFNAGGTLEFDQVATPAAASYTLLTAGSINGRFATVTGLPPAYRLIYNAGSIVLQRQTTLYVDATANGTASGLSWGNAFPTLQDALEVATAGDQIRVAAGTYYPDEGGRQTDGDRAATFTLKSGVTLKGGYPVGGGNTSDPESNPTTLSGDLGQNDLNRLRNRGENAYHVVTGTGVDQTSILQGFRIMAGNASELGNRNGAGLYCNGSGSPAFMDCEFRENQAMGEGGALYVLLASPTFTNCTFQGNKASADGGAVQALSSSASFINCVFVSNLSEFNGGAVSLASSDVTPTFSNCTFQGNSSAGVGGAILLNESNATFTNCLVWNNKAGGSTTSASASFFKLDSTPSFSHCLVENWTPAQLSGTANLDGTDSSNDPLFIIASNINDPPFQDGDLRLRANSPLVDRGDNSANSAPFDLAGRTRIFDGDGEGTATIDIGAYETRLIHVDGTASGYEDGTSWADAFPTVRDALAIAGDGDEIRVAAGTYYPDEGARASNGSRISTFNVVKGTRLIGGFASGGSATPDHSSNPTILSGDLAQNDTVGFNNYAENAIQVVTVSVNGAVLMDGFIIRGGKADGTNRYVGAGIYIAKGSATIRNCIIERNRAQRDTGVGLGGGVYNGPNASTTFINCTFRGNYSADGGAMANQDATVTVINCVFQGNRANDDGGAIYTSGSSSDVSFINASFQGNRANSMGGASYRSSGTVRMTNCLIWNNNTPSGWHDSLYGNHVRSYSLIEHFGAGGTGNLDGTDSANNPQFEKEVDPLSSPTIQGSLRLLASSPAIGAGSNDANSEATDVTGEPRVSGGLIDMGAHEFGASYYAWISGFYPGETDAALIGPAVDPNADGWMNVHSFILAGSPTTYHQDLLPTRSKDATYFIYEYARSDRALDLDSGVEYGVDMSTWTRAVHGQNGVVIEVEDDGFGQDASGFGIDKVTVKIPRNGLNQLFCQLVVNS